jgi:hypothetical protein
VVSDPLREPKVDEYIQKQGDWKADVLERLRTLVLESAPESREAYKWAQPVYEFNGPFCYMKAFKRHINFGFWRGAELTDPLGLLDGSGEKMRHVRLAQVEDFQEEAFRDFIHQAVHLNQTKGDPTKG